MSAANAIGVDAFSMIILGFIYGNLGGRIDRSGTQYKLFAALILNLALLLIFDVLSLMTDGRTGGANPILNRASITALYLVIPSIPSLWVLFTDYQVRHDSGRLKKLIPLLSAFVLLDAAGTVASVFTGWYFYFDASNSYHRGPYLSIHVMACLALLLYTYVFILLHRKHMDGKHFFTLLLFALPAAITALLQYFIQGVSLTWSGMALSVLIVYVNIQDRQLNTDYLTGVYNRRLLDNYMENKVKGTAKGSVFSAILIDLDDFKLINDNFGHDAGDEALLNTVKLLKGCLRHGDLISRYGGDEFLIILDIDREDILEETVQRIRCCFDRYNEASGKPYNLKFSSGYAVYNMASGMDPEQFIKHIDVLMYQDKKKSLSNGEEAWH